jgi:hypothetical protein
MSMSKRRPDAVTPVPPADPTVTPDREPAVSLATSDASDELALTALATGRLYRFADWPNPDVPHVAYGVYTVWLPDGRLLYAGMSGRSALDPESVKRKGLWTRLDSHASGQRSGDKFCIYVCDRFVIPTLSADQLRAVGDGTLRLDALTKQYVRESLSYRFVTTLDSRSAFRVERLAQGGALDARKPILNPR